MRPVLYHATLKCNCNSIHSCSERSKRSLTFFILISHVRYIYDLITHGVPSRHSICIESEFRTRVPLKYVHVSIGVWSTRQQADEQQNNRQQQVTRLPHFFPDNYDIDTRKCL